MTAMVVGHATARPSILSAHRVNARHTGSGRYKNIDLVEARKISIYKRFTKDFAPLHDDPSRRQFIIYTAAAGYQDRLEKNSEISIK
jgi:hypothetical protein